MPTKSPQIKLPSVDITEVIKRDLRRVPFEADKVTQVAYKALADTKEGAELEALMVTRQVLMDLKKLKKIKKEDDYAPTVEEIQDLVEESLMELGLLQTAKAFILYRQKRAEERIEFGTINPEVAELAKKSKSYFRNALGEFIYYRTYSRWLENEQRRETWIETVDRYVSFMKENLGTKISDTELEEVRTHILEQKVMPSMRLMQFAGPAARRANICAYNCSFIAPEKIEDFAEIMFISMCGTGVGFSVESKNIEKLPQVEFQTGTKEKTFVIPDSKEGWCDALKFGMKAWFGGSDIEFDYSLLRPAGARLMTMGGRSSGPDPLRRLLDFTRRTILSRQGRRLRTIDAHDIICTIGDIVVSGGVRRSALISLSDLDDTAMRDAKNGQFWMTEPQRSIANNSAVYEVKPSQVEFMSEWMALIKSGSGERGIFNRDSLKDTLPKRRLDISTPKQMKSWGTNPCGEIILRSRQFCNLSEVICRYDDTKETLMKKIRVATILGTYQSSLTNFPYLSKEWKKNCDEEALLGVSLSGQWDCPVVRDAEVLKALRDESIKINKKYAKQFEVNQSTCITCVKPSGTVSQTFDTSSGMHPRHSEYYIRRVRISATDSLFKMLRDQGVPYSPEVGQSPENATTYVIGFPVRSPGESIYKDEISALEQLEHWKLVKVNYTEHNPSVTISVGDNEWLGVANWVYDNWEIVGGLSFLPRTDHVYQLAPYEEITKEQFAEMSKKFEHIDYSKILNYEKSDVTDVKKELACVSGVCEIDDIPVVASTTA